MEKIQYGITFIIVFFVFFGIMNQMIRRHSKSPKDWGGEDKEIDSDQDKTTIHLKRQFGMHGTTLVTSLKYENDKIELVKGYIEGHTGFQFSALGQKLGIGVSFIDSWIEEKREGKATVVTAYIRLNRLHFLMFNEAVTFRVGSLKINPAGSVIIKI